VSSALSIELAPEAQSIPKARRALRDFAKRCGADAPDIALAASEAVTNALVHGYRKTASGSIGLRAWLRGDHLIVRVVDHGAGMRPHREWPGLGIGLKVIRLIADEVSVDSSETGVCITMRFPCRGARHPHRDRRA
jgi:anti-sigma regulatory factor (Ser/Thr protein kinase)